MSLAPTYNDYNYQQTIGYLETISKIQNSLLELVGVYENAVLQGIVGVRIKKIPGLNSGMAYLAGGPLVLRPRVDMITFTQVISALARHYAQEHNYFLRIAVPIWDTSIVFEQISILEKLDFSRNTFLPPYSTSLLDLSIGEEQLKKNFHKKWRYLLNASLRNELSIRTGTIEQYYEEFFTLFEAHKDRKGFKVNLEPDFYRQVERASKNKQNYIVQLVEQDGVVIAGHIGSYVGDTAVYLFGASSEQGNAVGAPYLLQFQAIRKAIELGLSHYDTGGMDQDKNPGVYV
ncbi:MAG: hypothetical protein ACI90U_001299 [Pseudomonadales bacterium]|jgi:hypothetical protein